MTTILVTAAPRASVPEASADEKQHRRQLAQAANRALAGALGNTFIGTLATGTSTTTINDSRASMWSCIAAMPQTADAAAELASGAMFITCTAGVITITHRNAATADRTFTFAIVG